MESTAASPLPSAPGSEPAGCSPESAANLLQLELIMRRYNQRLYRLAFGLVGDASEAEDVLQDSYVRAFKGFATFAGRSDLGVWLARIVRNQAIDCLRARRARRSVLVLEAEMPVHEETRDRILERIAAPEAQSSLELDRSREEARAALQLAIATLPLNFRAVFMLREVEGMSVAETAEYLGIAVATVKTRDRRARKLLREELGPAFDGCADGTFEFLRERCDRIVARVRALLT